MRKETRQAVTDYLTQIAQLNGVPSATEKFTVDPTVQQTLENKIQESSEFLGKINIIGVTEQQGEKLGLGIGAPVSSNTDTSTTDRATTDPTDMDATGYICTQTNFDTHLKYSKLDAWAKFPDFQIRVRNALLIRQALDTIMIGFNGTSRAATSNKTTNNSNTSNKTTNTTTNNNTTNNNTSNNTTSNNNTTTAGGKRSSSMSF